MHQRGWTQKYLHYYNSVCLTHKPIIWGCCLEVTITKYSSSKKAFFFFPLKKKKKEITFLLTQHWCYSGLQSETSACFIALFHLVYSIDLCLATFSLRLPRSSELIGDVFFLFVLFCFVCLFVLFCSFLPCRKSSFLFGAA